MVTVLGHWPAFCFMSGRTLYVDVKDQLEAMAGNGEATQQNQDAAKVNLLLANRACQKMYIQ